MTFFLGGGTARPGLSSPLYGGVFSLKKDSQPLDLLWQVFEESKQFWPHHSIPLQFFETTYSENRIER
jgi:hypothetical protein